MGIFNFVPGAFKRVIEENIDQRMIKAGKAAVAEATRLVPVRTGQLRDSIGFTYIQSEKTLQLHADEPYAIFVEYGTPQMRAQPYLRPALNAVGRIWGGNTEIQLLNIAHGSGKTTRRGSAKIQEYNAKVFHKYSKGASGRARVTVRGRHRYRYPTPPLLMMTSLVDLPP